MFSALQGDGLNLLPGLKVWEFNQKLKCRGGRSYRTPLAKVGACVSSPHLVLNQPLSLLPPLARGSFSGCPWYLRQSFFLNHTHLRPNPGHVRLGALPVPKPLTAMVSKKIPVAPDPEHPRKDSVWLRCFLPAELPAALCLMMKVADSVIY